MSHYTVPVFHLLLQVLSVVEGPLCEPLGVVALALVEGRLPVLVLQVDAGPGVHQVLGDPGEVPEGGVVEGRVAVLVDKVDVGLAAPQDDVDNVPVAVSGRQVERRVVPHVGRVHARSPTDQHLHNLGVAALGRPVQRAELVVVSVNTKSSHENNLFVPTLTAAFFGVILEEGLW